MDPVALLYYATICAVLSGFAPRIDTLGPRLLLGAAIGVAAAGSLPHLKAWIAG